MVAPGSLRGDSPELLGPLGVVVRDEVARGNHARIEVRARAVRGDAPMIALSRPLDVATLEAGFDLGPTLAWWPRTAGIVELCDTASGALTWADGSAGTEGTEGTADPASVGGAPARRRRVGYAADDRRWDLTAWSAPADETTGEASWRDVAVPTGTRVRVERAATAGATSSAELRDRVLEALAVLLPLIGAGSEASEVADAAPGWLRAAWAPERDAAGWLALAAHRDEVGAERSYESVRAAPWTAPRWVAALRPAERGWRWLSSYVEAAGVAVVLGVPTGSPGPSCEAVRFLLHAAGGAWNRSTP